MKIVERFLTLQGEGKYLGVPSYFIRTTGCNLRCAWRNVNNSITKCDTPYTSWQPEKGQDLNIYEVLDFLKDKPVRHIVITGGEPMMQKDISNIVDEFKDYFITVETNGTIYRDDMKKTFMSISPKLKSSYAQEKGSREEKIHDNYNLFFDTTQQWIKTNQFQLKFVVNEENDLEEILDLQQNWKVDNDVIYLMPQGISSSQFEDKSKWIFDNCVKYGFNYSPRMHIDLFGNKRGIYNKI